jgi:hypothetical protein
MESHPENPVKVHTSLTGVLSCVIKQKAVMEFIFITA